MHIAGVGCDWLSLGACRCWGFSSGWDLLFRRLVGWNEQRKGKGKKRTTTLVVVHFRDTLRGPPTPWVSPSLSPVPLVILPPQFLHPAKTSRPHPSRKGRGSCGSDYGYGYGWRWCPSPHPSQEGRGSWPTCCVWLRGKRSAEEERWWRRNERG